MPIRARVGRHANTGRQCQNWKDDQETVIKLLNAIPADKGGAAGSIGGRVIGGISSDALYQAILLYQSQNFPGGQTGFVEPGGPMIAKLGLPAPKPAPAPPKPAGQWSDLKTKSVIKGLNDGLDGDLRLSHAEVVNIVRATLSDGIITADEIADLDIVSTKSRSIESRSRRMLDMLIAKIRKSPFGKGPYSLATSRQRTAADMACDFLERNGATSFPYLDRMDVGTGLLMRIASPGTFNQDQAGLCGPASLLYNVASDNPVAFARYAIDLFEKGKAKIDQWEIEPGSDLRNYMPPESIDHVDWLTMASIRDSSNWFFDYQSISDSGGSTSREITHWFERSGYVDVRNETNRVYSADADAIDSANELFDKGYRIILRINANMLYEEKQSTEGKGNHVVALRSRIDRSGGKVRLKVFTWGQDNYAIPHGAKDLSLEDFLANFYGYVAGKPY
ncbi:hypothetical protein [Terrarubrum flagellatum]|uniref:hypothetical protein n=1 Tax=Terrirubrum flagellatum TaxID=2895980 RepID=UPI0031452112